MQLKYNAGLRPTDTPQIKREPAKGATAQHPKLLLLTILVANLKHINLIIIFLSMNKKCQQPNKRILHIEKYEVFFVQISRSFLKFSSALSNLSNVTNAVLYYSFSAREEISLEE